MNWRENIDKSLSCWLFSSMSYKCFRGYKIAKTSVISKLFIVIIVKQLFHRHTTTWIAKIKFQTSNHKILKWHVRYQLPQIHKRPKMLCKYLAGIKIDRIQLSHKAISSRIENDNWRVYHRSLATATGIWTDLCVTLSFNDIELSIGQLKSFRPNRLRKLTKH